MRKVLAASLFLLLSNHAIACEGAPDSFCAMPGENPTNCPQDCSSGEPLCNMNWKCDNPKETTELCPLDCRTWWVNRELRFQIWLCTTFDLFCAAISPYAASLDPQDLYK